MLRFKRLAPAAAITLLLVAIAGPAGAQTAEYRQIQAGSGADLGLYGLNSWDRTILGARARAMGGVSLAMGGEATSATSNPAALSSLLSPELTSETRYRLGSAKNVQSPTTMMAAEFGRLEVSDYRPGVMTSYTYNGLSFGLPVSVLGRRAAVALGYNRMIDFKTGEETRFSIVSPQGPADYGQGSSFNGGVDALTPALALDLTDWISVGATLNFMNGTITESGDQGVTTFGAIQARGGLSMNQDIYGTSLDLGTRIRINDRIRIGGVVQTGHNLKFRNGFQSLQPMHSIGKESVAVFYEATLMDHDLSVPTKFGAGMEVSVLNNRMTLGADYWNQAWSRSEITRNSFQTVMEFPDTSNLTKSIVSVIPGAEQVKRDAGLNDTHHLRFGAEYMIRQSANGGLQIPIRIGFRNEPFTFANFDTTAYQAAYLPIVAALTDTLATVEQKQARITEAIDNIYQNGASLLSGSKVPATTLTAGTGVRVGTFSAEFAVARTSYTIQRVFLGAFADFTRSADLKAATEHRSVTEFTFTTSLRF